MTAARLRKLVVIGVGLIGGSFASAIRNAGLAERIVGVDRDKANLDLAERLHLIDSTGDDYADALAGADMVLIAAPVAQFPEIFASLGKHLQAPTIVTDSGSTKQDVIAAAREYLGPKITQFVPAHPIAGAEQSGAGAANKDLFRHRAVVLTPLPENPSWATRRVEELWLACGARVHKMAPAQHDRIFAAVSHLPHLLAFALVESIARRPDPEEFFRYAAGGFRDFTRIASSSPEMWRDICLANRGALAVELASYRAQIDHISNLLASGDGEGLLRLFDDARRARNAWLERQEGGL